uniref:Uncharacterized protein n=1 Tax=Arundo donax TaxID=35708 RepID=A0A0A9EQT1_ARUDO
MGYNQNNFVNSTEPRTHKARHTTTYNRSITKHRATDVAIWMHIITCTTHT